LREPVWQDEAPLPQENEKIGITQLFSYLVGGLEHVFHILGIIIPTDVHIFQRGRAQPPTSYDFPIFFPAVQPPPQLSVRIILGPGGPVARGRHSLRWGYLSSHAAGIPKAWENEDLDEFNPEKYEIHG
jgi:hypothetical protein